MGAKSALATCGVVCAFSVVAADAVRIIGRVEHDALNEVSGIEKSVLGDFYWVHNDSGDEARLFAIDADSTVLKPPYVPVSAADWPGHVIDNAWNFDWEDIALADGVLYIADVGNNGNARRDLGVYVVNEPDPLAIPRMRALTFLPVRYPDQQTHPAKLWHFDCEAVFVADDKLYFITKHRRPGEIGGFEAGAKLYRLDTSLTDRENVLTLVGTHEGIFLATGADLSPAGSRLVVSTYDALWIFERPADGDNWLSGTAWRLDLDRRIVKQLEAVTWDDARTLRLVNENRDVMLADVAAFSPVDSR
ncbi:MAG: hypothetical protein OXL38_08135 [Gammaproteobacteria bacterium]|nr:hypothetical protein [Gammaproteobacteria bacterium]